MDGAFPNVVPSVNDVHFRANLDNNPNHNLLYLEHNNTAGFTPNGYLVKAVGGSFSNTYDCFTLRSDGVGYFVGNIGIGTPAPAHKLDVWGNMRLKSAPGLGLDRLTFDASAYAGGQTWILGGGDNVNGWGAGSDFALYNMTTGTIPFAVTPNDSVGIGITTALRAKLHINSRGTNGITNASYMPLDGTQNNLFIEMLNTATGGHWSLYHGDPDGGYGVGPRNFEIWEYPNDGQYCCRNRFRIENTYNVAPWTTAPLSPIIFGNNSEVYAYAFNVISDERTKENISEMNYGLKEIMKIKPRVYNYIGSDKKRIGFLAQELQAIVPEVVDSVPGESLLSVKYADMASLLVKAIQEQQKMIEDLKTEMASLREENAVLLKQQARK